MLANIPLDHPTHLHHPTTTPVAPAAGGRRQGAEPAATRHLQAVVGITGEAPIINQVSQDCVGSVTLATHVS